MAESGLRKSNGRSEDIHLMILVSEFHILQKVGYTYGISINGVYKLKGKIGPIVVAPIKPS